MSIVILKTGKIGSFIYGLVSSKVEVYWSACLFTVNHGLLMLP